jgi:capsule polysaccharide modification protein KpsS
VASVSAFIIALYLAVLVMALISRGRDFTHPWLFLLRGFFPSWRFFDAPGPQPRLFVRMLSEDERWSAWTMYIPRAPFRLRDLFFNAENNLRLAEQTLIDHFSLELQSLSEGEHVEKLVSYALTQRLAHRVARTLASDQKIKAYQFELRLLPGLSDETTEHQLLVSPFIKEASDVS